MSTNTPNEKGTPQSRTYTVNDIAAILGIGRASAYKLANSGAFKTIRIGNMIRIAACGLGESLSNFQSLRRLKDSDFSHSNFLSGILPIKVV